MLLAFAAAAALAAPRPGELKTFGDWVVGCDNGRTCQAVALFPEGSFEGGSLAIKRGPEADAVPDIWITVRAEDGSERTPAGMAIDGQPFALTADKDQGIVVRDAASAAALVGRAKSIKLLDPKAAEMAAVSVKGSAAALLYMDEQQRRIGTVSALLRRGASTRLPPPPPLPVVIVPKPGPKPPRRLSNARVRQLLGRGLTACEHANALSVEHVRLDSRHSLALASHPCGNGAYNYLSSAYVIDEQGRARPAPFDFAGGNVEGFDSLVNAAWVPESRTLSTFGKGRGLGDCGIGQDYAWDGKRFRLVQQHAMPECRGSMDYITTWRAEVRPKP